MIKSDLSLFNLPNLISGSTIRDQGDFSNNLKSLNIEELLKILGKTSNGFHSFCFLEQMHGSKIVRLEKRAEKLCQFKNSYFIRGADGVLTDRKGVLLVIKTADCLPVLIFDPKNKVIGAVHAGWKGMNGNIIQKAIDKMTTGFFSKPKEIQIVIGPFIRDCCYKTKQTELKKLTDWQDFLKKNNGFWHIDLGGKIKRDFVNLGIKNKNIKISPVCTGCDRRFFSFTRFKQGKDIDGRFISYIGIKEQ